MLFTRYCPKCGDKMILEKKVVNGNTTKYIFRCQRCGYRFTEEYVYHPQEEKHERWRRC